MPNPILTPEQEADAIMNVINDPEDEIGFWSKRLLQIHYDNLPDQATTDE